MSTFFWETMYQHFLGKQWFSIFWGKQWFSIFFGNNGSAFFYPEKTPVGKFRCHSNIIFQPLFTSGIDLNNSSVRFHASCSAVELYNKPYAFFAILKLDGSIFLLMLER